MKIEFGNGKTQYGPGVQIDLTGDEVATAIHTYLEAHNVHINGARTITVNGKRCEKGGVYVDPSGFVVTNGEKLSGRGKEIERESNPSQEIEDFICDIASPKHCCYSNRFGCDKCL